MNIITELKRESNIPFVDILHFRSDENDSSEFMEYDMPYPLGVSHRTSSKGQAGYSISWAIDGYAGTQRGKEYKFDTVYKISKALNATPLDYLPNYERPHKVIYNYSDFRIDINARKTKHYEKDILITKGDKDLLFEYCRFDIYALKDMGTLSFENVLYILETANERLGFNKSHSDIKAKAKNMYRYTDEVYAGNRQARNKRYYQKNRGENIMTIQQANTKIGYEKILKNKAIIKNTMMIMRKLEEKVSTQKIADKCGLTKRTVLKYYKEFL
ncbi:MAG: hypothetical protein KAI79_11630 [Bacteroidales bacterium]|nr:hypothetical protein [Bacteroidales bacterium]